MRNLLVVLVVAAAAAVTASCGEGSESCRSYYETYPAGLTTEQVDFCLAAGTTKQDGNCCVADYQCVSGKCCPHDAGSCGSAYRASCECYSP